MLYIKDIVFDILRKRPRSFALPFRCETGKLVTRSLLGWKCFGRRNDELREEFELLGRGIRVIFREIRVCCFVAGESPSGQC